LPGFFYVKNWLFKAPGFGYKRVEELVGVKIACGSMEPCAVFAEKLIAVHSAHRIEGCLSACVLLCSIAARMTKVCMLPGGQGWGIAV
jgi:hypothetical protein